MENETLDTSNDDLLKVFDTETTTSNATCSTSTSGVAAITDNLSNILGEINSNNYLEDDFLQVLNTNTGQRVSHRRSSILKVTEKMTEFRRTSNARRVSWAQTYQFKQLHSDGTTVISSQELNKYGPEPPPLPSGARRSSEFEPFLIANENVEPSSQENPLHSNDPHQERLLNKVKGKKRESFTRILSKFYNKDNEKDCETVINTAANRFGIDPTDINGILDPANPNRTELLKNSENANLTGFLQEFAQQQQQQTVPPAPPAKTAEVVDEPANLPVISPISGNIKTNLHVIDDTMNMSTFQQVCNSTRVAGDQDQTHQDFWKNVIRDTSEIGESIRQEKGTIHETTMMDMDLDSSGSNDKITKQSAVASTTDQTKADAVVEKQNEESEFLALLKGNADEPSEMATDTFEFSFQQPQPNAPTAADTEQLTQGLTSILADDKANDVPSLVPDANLPEQYTAGLTMEFATETEDEGADPFMQQLLDAKENSQEPADFADATTMDFTGLIDEKSVEVTSKQSMDITSGLTLALETDTAAKDDVSMVITEQDDANETLKHTLNTSVEKCLRVFATDTSSQDDFVNQHKVNQHNDKSCGNSLILPTMEDITFEKTADTQPEPTATAVTTGLQGFTDLFANEPTCEENNDLPGDNTSFNSTLKVNGDESDSISSLLKDSPDSSMIDRSGLTADLSLPEIKVSVYEITKNLDTQEIVTGEEGTQEKTAYEPTKPFLGKSASMIIDEELEFSAQSVSEGGVTVPETEVAEKTIAEESATEAVPNDISMEALSSQEKTVTDIESEAVPTKTEVSVQSPEKSTVDESPQKSPPKASKPPTPKRPYDFTILDSVPMMEQQLKFARGMNIPSAITGTSSLRTSAFPSVLPPITRSRIPILPGCQRPAVGASTIILRGLGSKQPKPQPSQPSLQQQPPKPLDSTPSSNQVTTNVLSNLNKTVTKVVPTVVNSATKQIEMDFNQSTNRSINNSCNDSTGLDSPIATRIVENCIRKSIGFGMRNRLIEKAKQLNLQREQATVQMPKTVEVVVETPLEKSLQATEEPTMPMDVSEVDVVAPSTAIDECASKTDMPINVENKQEQLQPQTTRQEQERQSLVPMEEDKGDNTEKRFSVKLSVKGEPALPTQITESPANNVQMNDNLDEAADKSIIAVDTSNLSIDGLSFDSIKFEDGFYDEIEKSDTSSITTGLLGQQRTFGLKNLIEEASQSIANASKLSEFSDGDTSEKKEELESTLSVTLMPLNESIGLFLNQSLNFTKNFSDDPFSDSLTAEWLEEYKAETAGDDLYRCISKLDFSRIHIRIHEMGPNSCMVRFLWGTLEVLINFGTAEKEGAPRPMTFYNNTRLSNNKPIPYEVMRGFDEMAKYDSDELFMSFDEAHRPFLNLAHKYVNIRLHDEYHQLLKKYPDSSMLADLLSHLSNIVETARKLCVELQHMHEREFMDLMPAENDDCFKFKVRLLGVRLVSHFYLEFEFDPMKYPYEVIRPTIIVPPKDQHLYPIDQFKAALLMVKPGNFNYLEGLVKGAQFFVTALRKVILRNLKLKKQKAELEGGVHLFHSPANNTNL